MEAVPIPADATGNVLTLRALTVNDDKILGRNTVRKRTTVHDRERAKLQKDPATLKSNWTPLLNRASNEAIFYERSRLVYHWYDVWTDNQRRRLLDQLLYMSTPSQRAHVRNWFEVKVPIQRIDFTTVIPRWCSLKIMAFLDAKSLSRAAKVSWHWKTIVEQDCLWEPKCKRRGWYLPYTPTEFEYGAWKRHYISCVLTMDFTPHESLHSGQSNVIFGTLSDGQESARRSTGKTKLSHRLSRISLEQSYSLLEARPEWKYGDSHPKDLNWDREGLLQGHSQFQQTHGRISMNHGALDNLLSSSRTDDFMDKRQSLAFDEYGHVDSNKIAMLPKTTNYGLQLSQRSASSVGKHSFSQKSKRPLSQSMDVIRFEEECYSELRTAKWSPPQKHLHSILPDLSGGGISYPQPCHQLVPSKSGKIFFSSNRLLSSSSTPRVLLISSRIPAYQVLLDAVSMNVLTLVYEYESTTLDTLTYQLEELLQGQLAKSIGLLTHAIFENEVRLVEHRILTLSEVEHPDIRQFIYKLVSHTLPRDEGGHIDIFTPLAAYSDGSSLLGVLNEMTDSLFCAPIYGLQHYQSIQGDWSDMPESNPSELYFIKEKFIAWMGMAQCVKNAVDETQQCLAGFFNKTQTELTERLAGQIFFEALGPAPLTAFNKVADLLKAGLLSLHRKRDNTDPVKYLAMYLLHGGPEKPIADTKLDSSFELPFRRKESQLSRNSGEYSGEQQINSTNIRSPKRVESQTTSNDMKDEEAHMEKNEGIESSILQDTPSPLTHVQNGETNETPHLNHFQQHEGDFPFIRKVENIHNFTRTESITAPRIVLSNRGQHVTPEEYSSYIDKRHIIAHELVAVVATYLRTLENVEEHFVVPLKRSLNSNRPILSAHNVETIFSDLLSLKSGVKDLLDELNSRLDQWHTGQCLGPSLIHFTGTYLKTYDRYVLCYCLMLRTLDRCREENPLFRDFLQRREHQVPVRMLSLTEIFLLPREFLHDLFRVANWFQDSLPIGHEDRNYLDVALHKLKLIYHKFLDEQHNIEREKKLKSIEKMIHDCPMLVEPKRYYVLTEDVALLTPPEIGTIDPDYMIYKHLEDCGLFLFSDSLIVTRRAQQSVPFERRSRFIYHYQCSLAVERMNLKDIPDSKFVRDAFILIAVERQWIFRCQSCVAKHRLISTLEQTIRLASDLLFD